MTTARQVEANRANARKSTGPRTKHGKARASRNACRHGLSISVLTDSGLSKDVEDLARKIVGDNSKADLIEPARAFAEAQVDLARIRRARHELLSRGIAHPDHESKVAQKRKPAATSLEESATGRFAVNLSDQVRKLARLTRYERRALSRRKFATRAFDAARDETE